MTFQELEKAMGVDAFRIFSDKVFYNAMFLLSLVISRHGNGFAFTQSTLVSHAWADCISLSQGPSSAHCHA